MFRWHFAPLIPPVHKINISSLTGSLWCSRFCLPFHKERMSYGQKIRAWQNWVVLSYYIFQSNFAYVTTYFDINKKQLFNSPFLKIFLWSGIILFSIPSIYRTSQIPALFALCTILASWDVIIWSEGALIVGATNTMSPTGDMIYMEYGSNSALHF